MEAISTETVASIVLGLLSFFLLRTMKQLDKTVETLTAEVSDLKGDRKVQEQLNEFLGDRLEKVEDENSRLRRILAALDKIIYAKLGIDIHEL